MAYDPRNDEALRCACGSLDESLDEAYPDGWDDHFTDLVAEQMEIMRASSNQCPRASVRDAIGRCAVAIAAIAHSNNKSDSSQDVSTMLRDVPAMLADMTGDALTQLESDRERPSRGVAAGYRRLN